MKKMYVYVYLCGMDRESMSTNDEANGAKCYILGHSGKRVYECFLNYSYNFSEDLKLFPN